MADGGAGSCLSDLSDDLLRHILFFAPAKEGAATAALSRRWRWLWRTSGAVNLDSRSWTRRRRSSDEPSDINRKRKRRSRSRSCSRSTSCSSSSSSDSDNSRYRTNGKDFVRSAEQALAAAAGPIRRLTFFFGKDTNTDLTLRGRREDGSWSAHNMAEALISNPVARRVEELRMEVKDSYKTPCRLSFGSLPSEALRVLHIRSSTLTAALPPGATFPRLADLHLQCCSVDLEHLLSTIAAAPQLSTLHLQSSYFSIELEPIDSRDQAVRWYRFLCPAVTALVIADCTFGDRWDNVGVELDVPRLQYFRYEGSLQVASRLRLLKTQAALSNKILPQVDLHLFSDRHCEHNYAPICKLFWQFVQYFDTARLLKVKLDLIMDKIVLKEDEGKDELLGSLSFGRLEQLELEGKYNPRLGTTTVLLADLLHCCPMVRDLRLKLINIQEPLRATMMSSSVDKEAGVDFDKSVNGFRNRRRTSMASLGVENGENYQAYGNGIIPGLTSERAFSCLQSHLERVRLHFCMDEPNCLGVQLAKFFAEKAMVLQEMHIDDGGQEMLEHVNQSLRRWIEKENYGKVYITP